MTIEHLTAMIRANPFQPFRIHLADGRHLDVKHRDFIMRSPSGRSAILYNPDETFEVIDLRLVATLKILNGKKSRGRKT